MLTLPVMSLGTTVLVKVPVSAKALAWATNTNVSVSGVNPSAGI